MSTMTDLKTAQTTLTDAIAALAARVAQHPTPVATQAELDEAVTTVTTQTAAVNAITLPTP